MSWSFALLRGHLETLGQVRWDHDLEHEVLAPFRVENVVVGGKNYIKDVPEGAAYTGNFLKESRWQAYRVMGL